MAEKREIKHPLTRRQFYAECFRYAATGVWGVTGDLSTGLPLAALLGGLLMKHLLSHQYAAAAAFLKARGIEGDALLLVIPAAIGGLILWGRLVTAPFAIYRDKATVPVDATPSGDASRRDELVVLAGQLRQFLNARSAEYDAEFGGLPTMMDHLLDVEEMTTGSPGKRQREKDARKTRHTVATLEEYGNRFAGRVLSANRQLRELGVNDESTARLDKYPTTIAELDAIIRDLETASNAIPDVPSSQVSINPDSIQEMREALRGAIPASVTHTNVTGPPSVFDVPSIVIAFRYGESEVDDETGEEYSPELLSFTNVGPVAATSVTIRPFQIMQRLIEVPEVPVLLSNGVAEKVRVFGLTDALWKARRKLAGMNRGNVPIRIKLTLGAGMWAQHEGMQWEYALTYDKHMDITIKRINPDSPQEWTDLGALDGE